MTTDVRSVHAVCTAWRAQASYTALDVPRTVELKPGGSDLAVTNANRDEFVHLYCNWALNESIYAQFEAFYRGFHSVCASNALLVRDAPRPVCCSSRSCLRPVASCSRALIAPPCSGFGRSFCEPKKWKCSCAATRVSSLAS